MKFSKTIALIGNPNVGKTSLFNQLTGLKHKVGNYPGITVDKKSGTLKHNKQTIEVVDLPGTYSIYPSSKDEQVVLDYVLVNQEISLDLVLVVADPENLKRNLLLFSQLKDLQLPAALVINMSDKIKKKGISIDVKNLSDQIEAPVLLVSSSKQKGIEELKEFIVSDYDFKSGSNFIDIKTLLFQEKIESIKEYKSWVKETHNFESLSQKEISSIKRVQKKETVLRYNKIRALLKYTYIVQKEKATDVNAKLDKLLLHPIFGYLFFLLLLGLIFQSVFSWSSIPMDWIDEQTSNLASWVQNTLPPGAFTNLLSEGVVSGLGGVIIFVPQIAYLFLFITLLEETGYMSRVVILMDRIMRPLGLSGKSIVPLVSGTACAIPAVMATRNIENKQERFITILVTPLTTCSARLPVYTIIIALVIPEVTWLGFNVQGLVLFGLYFIGFFTALFIAWVFNLLKKAKDRGNFIIEVPNYQIPSFKRVLHNVYDRTMDFVWGAGKIILAISIVLWAMASYGPGDEFCKAEEKVTELYPELEPNELAFQDAVASYQLEHSYIGYIGKGIEPVIKPLGYDWKIGIAIVASFAAREVFVGTLATIYSIGSAAEDEATIKKRIAAEINPVTKKPTFTLAVGLSILLFYAFAMQCMSTLAIVKKETGGWKIPVIQFIYMGVLAYLSAWIVFNIFS